MGHRPLGPSGVDALAAAALDELGGVDVLVNNAGIPKRRHVTRLDPTTVESVMNINFFSPVRLTLALLPHMLERDSGQIVNVSSVAATLSSPGESAYDASKAAMTAFSESMAIDLWQTGIKVLVVYPGLVDTELFSLPDNDPVMAAVEAVPVSELVDGVFDALDPGAVQVYVPGYFADLASGKAGDVEGFLSGTAQYIAAPAGSGLISLPFTAYPGVCKHQENGKPTNKPPSGRRRCSAPLDQRGAHRPSLGSNQMR